MKLEFGNPDHIAMVKEAELKTAGQKKNTDVVVGFTVSCKNCGNGSDTVFSTQKEGVNSITYVEKDGKIYCTKCHHRTVNFIHQI